MRYVSAHNRQLQGASGNLIGRHELGYRPPSAGAGTRLFDGFASRLGPGRDIAKVGAYVL
jgi:hypothetical protein